MTRRQQLAPARLSAQPWWTAADQAELDVLIDAFVQGYADHRERCSICSTRGPWCDGLRGAHEVLVAFRDTRARISRAAWLRTLENVAAVAA